MIFFTALLLDFVIGALLQNWVTNLSLAAGVFLVCLKKNDLFPFQWLGLVLVSAGLSLFDVVRYGRVGISILVLFVVWGLQRAISKYFMDTSALLIYWIVAGFAVLTEIAFILFFSPITMSPYMTTSFFLGRLASLMLVFLGVWGSRSSQLKSW